MNDTQRLDWLERNPERLLVHSRSATTFSILLKLGQPILGTAGRKWTDPQYSTEYGTIREAIDEGMKHGL